MRVLFATTRGAGHFGPLVPFAHACVRAGHEVLVAGPASVAGLVARAGLRFRPVGEAPPAMVDAAFAPVWRREASVEHVVRDLFIGLYARTAMADMLTAVDEWRPDLIVRETMEFASAVAAVRYDVPQARVGIHLDSRIDSGSLLEALAADVLGIDADTLREGPLLTRAPGDEPGVHRFRTDALPRREPEVVYISFGSEAPTSHHFPGVYRRAIEALAGLPVLMTIGDRRDPAELGPLPPHTRVERWLDQEQVMPRAAAMVSHGGSGSTLTALAAGVPQVFVPLFVDGPANAARVAELGAGIVAGDDLRAAVETVVTDAYVSAAQAVAGEIAALPRVDDAIEVFARVSSQARTGVRRDYRSAAGQAIR
jgi:UDP:flavonoid glycosyltransferase YjiC (YdhE family)